MILTRMLEASGGQPQAQHQPQGHVQAPPPIPAVPSYPVYNQMPPPPPPNMYAAPPQQPQSYYRGPPPQPTPPPQMAMPNVTEEQKAVLLQVLSMPQERINALPEGERNAIQQLVSSVTLLRCVRSFTCFILACAIHGSDVKMSLSDEILLHITLFSCSSLEF